MKTYALCITCHRKILLGGVECIPCYMLRVYGPTPTTVTAAPMIRNTAWPPCPRRKGRP